MRALPDYWEWPRLGPSFSLRRFPLKLTATPSKPVESSLLRISFVPGHSDFVVFFTIHFHGSHPIANPRTKPTPVLHEKLKAASPWKKSFIDPIIAPSKPN